jgi:hypothetical protein
MKMDRIIKKRLLTFFLIIVMASITAIGQTGSIEGIATDKKNKETLPGVMITIEGTTIGASADIEGHFIIPNIKPGKYKVKASYISYTTLLFEDVKVEANRATHLDISMAENAVSLSGVTVTGVKKTNTEVALICYQDESACFNRDFRSADSSFAGQGCI